MASKRVINLFVGKDEYDNWNREKTKLLLTVFEGGYCIECGCINNYKLKYDYVPYMSILYDNEYRVIGFNCIDCGCEYKVRVTDLKALMSWNDK